MNVVLQVHIYIYIYNACKCRTIYLSKHVKCNNLANLLLGCHLNEWVLNLPVVKENGRDASIMATGWQHSRCCLINTRPKAVSLTGVTCNFGFFCLVEAAANPQQRTLDTI